MHCALYVFYEANKDNYYYNILQSCDNTSGGGYKRVDIFLKFSAMHFIYYINGSIVTKVDLTYLGY